MNQKKGVKRSYVDSSGNNELPNPKRTNIEMDKSEKLRCLAYLTTVFNVLLHSLAEDKEDLLFVNLGCQISSCIYTCHTMLRQHSNGAQTFYNKYAGAQGKFILYNKSEKTIAYADILKLMEGVAGALNIPYKSAVKTTKSWYGTFNPILSFFQMFMPRLKELRVGHAELPRGKTEKGDAKCTPVSLFGVSPAHHVLLEGISFTPSMKSTVAQSLGPATAWIMLTLSEKAMYRRKWEQAVKRNSMNFPDIDEGIAAAAGMGADRTKNLIAAACNLTAL